MTPFKYAVSFRIKHPSIDPRKISAKLRLTPDTSWRAGEARKTPKGKPLKGRYNSTYWSYTLKHSSDMNLADCLESFTNSLEPHKGLKRN